MLALKHSPKVFPRGGSLRHPSAYVADDVLGFSQQTVRTTFRSHFNATYITDRLVACPDRVPQDGTVLTVLCCWY
jgi:hypothetical protein